MFKDKKVVVVMPAYNAVKTIEKTYTEVMEQHIVDLVIIVDDASPLQAETAAMLRRVGVCRPLVFAGGVAHNPCVVKLLEEELGRPVIVAENPDMVGAIGAALYGQSVAVL